MSIVLPALCVAFGALCVWLAVRIVNRRERWAKWTLAAVAGLPMLYVASIGPACRIAAAPLPDRYSISTLNLSQSRLCGAYWPIGWFGKPEKKLSYCAQSLLWYAHFWLPDKSFVAIPTSSNGGATWVIGKE